MLDTIPESPIDHISEFLPVGAGDLGPKVAGGPLLNLGLGNWEKGLSCKVQRKGALGLDGAWGEVVLGWDIPGEVTVPIPEAASLGGQSCH